MRIIAHISCDIAATLAAYYAPITGSYDAPYGPISSAYVKKGALIKSYRYSHALITPRFTM